jgi:hypothetical protein
MSRRPQRRPARQSRPPAVMCGRKRRHPTQLDAIASAIRCSARAGHPLRVYACPDCGGWHLTRWATAKPSTSTTVQPAQPKETR